MTESRSFKISDIFKPQGKQLEFYLATKSYQFILYGGAAGGGKSWILRWWLLIFLLEAYVLYGIRDVRVGLFCEDYPALKDRQMAKIETEFPRWLGELREDRALGLIFRLKEEYGGGFIALRNLDDPGKYDSIEFAAIAVDELGKNKQPVFDELRKRLRWPTVPDEPHFPCGKPECQFEGHDKKFIHPFGAGTNPGGIGHNWIKNIWIDPLKKGDWSNFPKNLTKIKDRFFFIQALASDNSFLPEDYYEMNLQTLPENMRRAMADGDWDLFDGQYFSEWREKYHVCESFEIPAFWTKYWAGDWGYFPDYFCGLWFAVSTTGDLYVYREVYGRQIIPSKWAERLLEDTGEEKLEYRKLDSSSWGKWLTGESESGVTIAQEFEQGGWPCTPGASAPGDRINGWTRIREYLAWEEDESLPAAERCFDNLKVKPKLHIFNTCRNLIRTLPILIHDEFKVEDVQRKGLEDHAPDALRYGVMTRPAFAIQPIEQMDPDWQDATLLFRERTGTLDSPFANYQRN
jgi:phage terminase large subunit